MNGLCLDVTGVMNGELMKIGKCEKHKVGQLWQFEKYLS
jgi:hypothetical protein